MIWTPPPHVARELRAQLLGRVRHYLNGWRADRAGFQRRMARYHLTTAAEYRRIEHQRKAA